MIKGRYGIEEWGNKYNYMLIKKKERYLAVAQKFNMH